MKKIKHNCIFCNEILDADKFDELFEKINQHYNLHRKKCGIKNNFKEKMITHLLQEKLIFEDNDGSKTRQIWSDPYWLGYTQHIKESIKFVEDN